MRTHEPIAIKIQNKSRMRPEDILSIRHECEILSKLNHPHIIKIFGGYDNGTSVYWILSLMQGGDLFNYVTRRGPLNEVDALYLFKQLVQAVGYCHSKNIVHRDIKLENILLRELCETPQVCSIVLGDFGFATYQEPSGPNLTTFPGSPHYAAPELAQGIPYNGRASDIWAMGVCLFVMTQGRYPFPGDTPLRILNTAVKFPTPAITGSPVLRFLISNMLFKNPLHRISMAEIEEII